MIQHINVSKKTKLASYKDFKLVYATFTPEGKLARKSTYSKAYLNKSRQLKAYGYKPGKGLKRLNQEKTEPIDLPIQNDTYGLRYKKRYWKEQSVSHKIGGFIPHIRETFPYPVETILLGQAQERNVFTYQPALTINWTSLVPMGSIQELFEELVAMITGSRAIT